ncbi:Histone-lysine N-methyltransferase EZH1 [Fusarium oxysporum f. sp. raphani]|uniref:Histone-lysine N-methyltransferase EZH1 n=1 Tax=Fusarium oxysporum f. sp. raphani TaxID=96318 RepID=A0A8J5TPX9_FUSOX|nr:Histone-lysine N-methyltransferase EZH1 [Fusarium oxysporum f. sp. raphani]
MASRSIRSAAPAPAPARPPTQIDVINLSLDDSSDLANNASLPRRSPSPQPARLETTNARFCLIDEAGSPSHTPISPPQKRPGQSSFHSFEPSRPSQPTFRPVQKVTTSNGKSDDAQDMARSSGVRHPNLGHQQAMPSSEHHIKDGHARMTSYIIESTKPVERRVLTCKDLFAGLSSKPTLADEADTMRIKFKEHSKPKSNKREDYYEARPIQTDEERVPRYRFHHVEIKKNILTPNTMLTFVPHLRDLESCEESKYNVWLQELEDIDRKSGFKPMSREEKVRVTVRSEFASTVSLYLENWLDRLRLPGCDKSTLIRHIANRAPDDAITPRQKSDILNAHRPAESSTPPEANRAVEMFTEAFHRVFYQNESSTKQIALRDVLLLDESVDSIMDTKPTAKNGSLSLNENEFEAVEFNLGTYCILGCLICFSHSCEHGEYDASNSKRSLSMLPRLSDTLRRRRRIPSDKANVANGHSPNPCKRSCYHTSTTSVVDSAQRPWTPEEHIVMRSMIVTADHSRVKTDPFCIVAHLLDRDCRDVFHEYERLGIRLPPREPVSKAPIKTVSWYDRFKKALIGDWENRTRSQEHQQRKLIEPCFHEGPCTKENCICVQYGYLCEKYCGCTVENCAYKFTGCACHSQGKTCLAKQKDRPCICVQLHRECDPDLCDTCGILERADPENAEDELIHATGCQNCSLQRGLTKALALGQSQLEGVGYGLFAAECIAQGDFIIEYVGELITHDEGVRREARRGDVFDEESNISYVFTLLENEGMWVDAAIYGNLSRYINHASEKSSGDKRGCNITPQILYVNGEYRIKFTATRDIQAGEELFFNYGENFPNLTKKVLNHKAGEMSDEAKKRTRRPNRADHKRGVARKAPKSDKKKPGKGKPASHQDLEDEDLEMYESPEFIPKLPRKRKREVQDDSEEDEYHPTATDATGSCTGSPSTTDLDFGPLHDTYIGSAASHCLW